MSDRANRILWTIGAIVLLTAGGLGLCVATGVFGSSSSNAPVVTSTLVRDWRRGGAGSFAIASFLGLLMVLVGLWLARRQVARNEGRSRLGDFVMDVSGSGDGRPHGVTRLRAACLSHGLETDLERIPGVQKALVGLFEPAQSPRLRARVDVVDGADLEPLAASVQACFSRFERTASRSLDTPDITVRFVKGSLPRVT